MCYSNQCYKSVWRSHFYITGMLNVDYRDGLEIYAMVQYIPRESKPHMAGT